MMTHEQIADALGAAGIASPYGTDYAAATAWQHANPGQRLNWDEHLEWHRLPLDRGQLPEGWESPVHRLLAQRALDALGQVADAAFAALPENVRAAATRRRRLRHRKPELVNLSSLRPVSGRAYKPEPGCTMRLKLAEAVCYDYEQASYADHSRYVIPVEGEPGDPAACARNLGRFCEAIRTHNGMAGSGASWTMALEQEPGGWVVVADCRASIAD